VEAIRETPAATGSHQGPDHQGAETQSLSTASATAGQPSISTPQASLFGATRLAVQGALDRGELSQALLLLSDWYGDPSLAPAEKQEVDALLSQLAGSVIYSTEHRLEPSYRVQAGERLEDIARKYNVPWQLLAKINGLDRPDSLQPGQELKVLRGPFSALIDLGDRQLTVMLARRYAGKFSIDIDPQVTVEEGQWKVDQKLVTPRNLNMASSGPVTTSGKNRGSDAMEEESLVLTNTASKTGQIAILKGSVSASPSVATEPENRVIRMKTADVRDVFDILSVGSNVIIRR
jgi:LysM repeat protein